MDFDSPEPSKSGLMQSPIGSTESDQPPVIDLLNSEEVLTDIIPPGEL